MIQQLSITIDGHAIEVSSVSISKEINRGYSVATFTSSSRYAADSTIHITYGDGVFDGFVYASEKTSKGLYTTECRTYGAKLTEPYTPNDTVLEPSTTSHALCAQYASDTGVPIEIDTADISFGGSYERNGTILSAIENIAEITGAEYWDDGGAIRISPNKPIDSDGVEIPPTDIFDFVKTKNTVSSAGIAEVIISTTEVLSTDVVSENGIYAEIDECTGAVSIFPNPFGEVSETEGLSSLSATMVERTETRQALDVDIIRLDGAIDSISSVTVNGVLVSDYQYAAGHNVLYFSTPKRGTISVVYVARSLIGYANISSTPIGRFVSFDVRYLDQVLRFQGFLSADCNALWSSDGDMVCIVPDEMYYNIGFDVWTMGGDPSFLFYDRTERLDVGISRSIGEYLSVETATLEPFDGGYRYRTRYAVVTPYGARSSGTDIPFTITNDGQYYYYSFDRYYPRVSVSYGVTAVKNHVQFDIIDHGDIVMAIVNRNTGKVCEYALDTKTPCTLNQDIYIDVASELSVQVGDAAGKTVTYTRPSGATSSAVIDQFGGFNLWVDRDGSYTIDTSPVKPNSSLTLNVNTGA